VWISWANNGTTGDVSFIINPWKFLTYAVAVSSVTNSGRYYVPDLIDMVAPLFAFYRGSMRLKHVALTPSQANMRSSILSTRTPQWTGLFPDGDQATPQANSDLFLAGMPVTFTNSNYAVNELNIPYMSNSYATAINISRQGAITTEFYDTLSNRPGFYSTIRTSMNPTNDPSTLYINRMVTLRSIGEDFSFGFFTGTVPIISVRAGYPASLTGVNTSRY